ncbi:MAG: metallophosphoesterase [Candidatus Woesearchaeota archaeon]
MEKIAACNNGIDDMLFSHIGTILLSDYPHHVSLITKHCGIANGNILILGDLHMGVSTHHAIMGTDAFVMSSEELSSTVIDYVNSTAKEHSITSIVFNGDFIDEFALLNSTRRQAENMLYKLSKKMQIIIVRGNHDVMIDTISTPPNCIVANSVIANHNTLIFHGDKEIAGLGINNNIMNDIKRIIIGHEHSAINITDGVRSEKTKCVMIFCDHNIAQGHANVVLLPSCNPDIIGSNVSSTFMSPVLSRVEPKNAHIYALADNNIYYFGSLSSYNNT